MTGTGAFDFAVLGSPTVLRQTDRVTFSQPSDSSSWAGSKESQVSPLNSPKRSPMNAAVAKPKLPSTSDRLARRTARSGDISESQIVVERI